ncbi:hypothetical protein F5Y04DRAFT_292379, partial [Hypomontagnella monticulosa]
AGDREFQCKYSRYIENAPSSSPAFNRFLHSLTCGINPFRLFFEITYHTPAPYSAFLSCLMMVPPIVYITALVAAAGVIGRYAIDRVPNDEVDHNEQTSFQTERQTERQTVRGITRRRSSESDDRLEYQDIRAVAKPKDMGGYDTQVPYEVCAFDGTKKKCWTSVEPYEERSIYINRPVENERGLSMGYNDRAREHIPYQDRPYVDPITQTRDVFYFCTVHLMVTILGVALILVLL